MTSTEKISRALLILLHFVCPLLFFTNLTRNPYITQIALLNAGVLLAALFWLWGQSLRGEWALPRTRLDGPLAAWLAVCAASWLWGYFGHAEFYKESIRSEGLRAFLFTTVNALLVFYLAAGCAESCEERPAVPLGYWVLFCLIWGGLWTFFPKFRGMPGPQDSIWAQFFNPYGAFLWVGGALCVLRLARAATVHAFWHTALAVGFLASTYGIVQYFGYEFIWPKVLNPYGGRSVSTFGNPNFMSSYQVMLMPLAATYYLQAENRFKRCVYGALLLSLEAGLLCSLTRSSWVGAAAAMAPLLLSRRLREAMRKDVEFHGLLISAMALIAVFWPQSNIGGYTSSLFGRLGEVKHIFEENYPYSPWYQRVLIWMCAWTMGAENPLFGKGWGLFELFYPFYQGHFLDHFDFFRNMRTHANNSHNELLEIWAQTGIAGVGAFAWVWTSFFAGLWKEFRGAQSARPAENVPAPAKKKPRKPEAAADDGERVWLLAGGASVLGMLVDNLMNVSLHFAVPGFFFWWQVGVVAGHLPAATSKKRFLRPGRGMLCAAVMAFAAAAAAGVWYWSGYWNREANYFMGFKLMRQQRFNDAIRLLTRAYEWNSMDVNNNYELGNAYARANEPERALWAYEEALKANAGYDEIYFNRATIQLNLGRREEALASYRTSWAINPLSQQVYVSLSRLYLQDPAKYGEECIRLLERGAHFFPEDLNFLNNLGYLYSYKKQYEKAEEMYAGILEAQPGMAVVEKNLRTSLSFSGRRPPEILRRVEEFKRLEEDLKAGRFGPETLRRARQIIEWFPKSTGARVYAGNLEMINGDAAKAEGYFRAAVQDDPSSVPAMINLGLALKMQGKAAEAREAFRAVLAVDPQNARVRAELASPAP